MFIDTNVLVYARTVWAPQHVVSRSMLESASEAPEPMRISRQIIREYLSVMTRPDHLAMGITSGVALDDVATLLRHFEVLKMAQG